MFPNLFFVSLLFCSIIFTHSYHNTQCLDHQNNLLLQFKNELIFNSSISTKLVRWNHTNNCCHWHGVRCDGAGQVVSLQLDDESISGGIGDLSSLFRLKYLEKLNLAYNDFDSSLIPKGIKHLKYLTHLNLSNAGFSGQVPLEISSLKGLVSLDISTDRALVDNEPPELEDPNLEMLLKNLTRLRELYLDGMYITSSHERRNWSHIISSYLPNITTLSLRICSLYGHLSTTFGKLHSLSVLRLDGNDLSTSDLDLFADFSSLTTLSLGYCSLKGSLPDKIFQIPTLQHLDLSDNQLLRGSLPPFPHSGSLESLRLSFTNFSGSIPSSIGNLKTLSEIDLNGCGFGGPIPSTFANLTQLTHVDLGSNFFTGSISPAMFEGFSNLVYLNLGINSFTGSIPDSVFHLPSLQRLYLYNNNFTGVIEEFPVVNVSKIVRLYLDNNRLEGPIPNSFFQLQSLEDLYLSENLFNGSFQLEKIQIFANLTRLDLSRNNLSVHVGNDNSTTYGLPMLAKLSLRSCNIHNNFPDFIKHSKQMDTLDLSNNRISGEIPSWIWGTQLQDLNLSFNLLTHVQKPYNIPPSLLYLDLQSNQLREEVHLSFPPNITPRLDYLSLANNSLSGSIPTSVCSATDLSVLDLSMNQLSGTIPSCLFDDTMNLNVLDLGRNNISGHIPDSFRHGAYLQYLNLSNNTLQGEIPKSLKNCEGLELMNVGNNLINDTFPCMLSSLRVLVLRSNRFHGEVNCYSNDTWPVLQIIDISSNNFSGSLQSIDFLSWRRMVLPISAKFERSELDYGYFVLQLPKFGIRITMKGIEVELVKIYSDFTSIDFSCNNFHGEISNAIGGLSSLRLLNLSHNAINGSIPESFGKLGELEALDLSQNQLTGHIPTELSRLTFLSVLNVSYNRLNGEIPKGSQLQTFPANSFLGNPGLCGFNLNISCIVHTDDGSDENEKEKKKREIEWEYVSAALGYGVGLGSFVWFLIFCRSFRYKYFGKIDEVVEEMFDAIDRRRRRRLARRRRAVRDREVRRH